ncbi:hypothetical protein [Streptomyces sp. NPDC046727]|uniref:hypothetical protein n=1 Tax=Streptomyces sp. NPDC046727 TaxID=3155373 RepID=UPI0033CFF1CF
MPESVGPVTELTSQYVSQVTNDLENNLKEQERITAEIAALQEQLATLQHDHAILLNMQQALGIAQPAGSPVVPAPRKKSGGTPRAETRKPGTGKSGAGKSGTGKTAVQKSPARKATSEAAQPTLIELVRRHLAEQSEPRSAAEVTEALGRAHPDRGIQTKVVRTTLENLVARNGAQRTKQGSSVFYTVPGEPAEGNTAKGTADVTTEGTDTVT